jgi:hypothetical protein
MATKVILSGAILTASIGIIIFALFVHTKKKKRQEECFFMKNGYTEEQVLSIAKECNEFEHIINAMGYGYSLLNVSPAKFKRRCPDCTHWFDSSCGIFRKEIAQWQ